MTEFHIRAKKSWAFLLLPALVSLAVSACEAPTRSSDYRTANPLVVGKEMLSLTVKPASGAATLGAEETANLQQFARLYHERGQGPLTVKAAAGDAAGLGRVREMLLREGVRAGEMAVTEGAAAGDVQLSFIASTLTAPACEDWSSNASFNWSNLRGSNYGCAYRRNMGLMVQDPADMEKSKGMGDADGERFSNVIDKYRKAPTQAGGAKKSAAGASQK
ncbi:MAG TPA: CpaD family pilus assembly lipoprotein [Rhodospirillales bacterium]|jgi:pilus biogenesis lipoprotein CpaD